LFYSFFIGSWIWWPRQTQHPIDRLKSVGFDGFTRPNMLDLMNNEKKSLVVKKKKTEEISKKINKK
jgi:hypothetical protein